jgi:integrase
LAYYVKKLQKDCPVLNPALDVSTIDEQAVTRFYNWLRNTNQSGIVQKKLWGYFRRMVRHFALQRLCPLPLNLDARIFSFDVTTKQIKKYAIEDVRKLYKSLPQRLKLYALLAMNTGALGVDMATLRHDELRGNRIVRKRTKTRKGENVPVVEYLLWDETVKLLNAYPRNHPEYVLTSKKGTLLWKAVIEDGKKKKYDLVSLQWHRGRGEKRKNKPSIPLKALRSVSSNLLKSNKEYADFADLFLGHAPSKMGEKHYYTYGQAHFDEAVTWLRCQFFPQNPM